MKLINYSNKLHDMKSANFENESDFFFHMLRIDYFLKSSSNIL